MDVLGFEPVTQLAEQEDETLVRLVERRLDRSAIRGWRIVGVAIHPDDLGDREEVLLRGLVAGDIVIAAGQAPDGAPPGPIRLPALGMWILVHRGDRLEMLERARNPHRENWAGLWTASRPGGPRKLRHRGP